MILLGIAGPKGVGKTTFKNTLLDKLPDSISIPLAAPLKNCCKAIFPDLDLDNKEDPYLHRDFLGQEFASARKILQIVGTDIFRAYKKNIWLDIHALFVKNQKCKVVIVDDVRFDNEATYIRNNGFLVHLKRNGVNYTNEHTSEKGVDIDKALDTVLNLADPLCCDLVVRKVLDL